MRPYLVLQLATCETKSQFIQGIAGTGHDLNLGEDAAYLNVGAECYPASFWMPGRRHQGKRLGARVHHHHTGGDRAPGVWASIRTNSLGAMPMESVKALLRRVEFGHILLPCRNNLVWSLRDVAQTDAIRFLLQLAENPTAVRRWAALHVPGTRSGRYFL